MSHSNELSAARLADRAAIHDAMLRWIRAVDRREWSLVKEAFHPDAHDNHGIYQGDLKGLVAWLSERHETIPHSSHVVSNMLIEFAGDDVAVVETYCVAYQRYGSGGANTRRDITGGADTGDAQFDMMINGRYVDRFERREGVWKIAHRTVIFDNSMMFPVPAGGPKLNPDWPIGTRDRSDPIWKLRAAAGLS
nr:nuclear transport factor 2 family protein [Mesorhizobium sp.]